MTTTLDDRHERYDGHEGTHPRDVRRCERAATPWPAHASGAAPTDRLDPWGEQKLAVDEVGIDEDMVFVPDGAAAEVADQIAELATGRDMLAAEVDQIAGDRAAVTNEVIERLETLVAGLRPAAQAHARLQRADAEILRAGVTVWQQRRMTGLGPAHAAAGRRAAR